MTTFLNADTIVGGAIITADASGVLGLQAAGSTQVTVAAGGVTLTNPLSVGSGGTGATSLAGANIPLTNAANTFTATQSLIGSSSTAGLKIADVLETASVSTIAATGTINYDITTQVVVFYTINASANWTVNFRGSGGTTLNTLMAVGESVTAAFLVTQGATAYFNSAVQIDGTTSGVTTRWQGGTAPSAGNPSGVDAYTYTIIKTANATFSVFAAQTRFA